MKKYQVIIRFVMDDQLSELIPDHQAYINRLIDNHQIEYYSVSMESQTCWMIANGRSKADIDQMLGQAPLYAYWQYDIEELFLYDAHSYRLPGLMMN